MHLFKVFFSACKIRKTTTAAMHLFGSNGAVLQTDKGKVKTPQLL